jgi:hypothetical protein
MRAEGQTNKQTDGRTDGQIFTQYSGISSRPLMGVRIFSCKKNLNPHWTSEIRSHCSFAHTPPKFFPFHPMLVLQGFFLLNFSFLLLGCHFLCTFIQNEIIQIETIQFDYIKVSNVQIEDILFWLNKQVVYTILFLPFFKWLVLFTRFNSSLITLLGPTSLPSYSIEPFLLPITHENNTINLLLSFW